MSDWAQLSRELWCNIFDYVQPDINNWEMGWDWDRIWFEEAMQLFLKLSQVCKVFQSILCQHQYQSALCLRHDLEPSHLSGLYCHILQHGSSVKHLVTACGSPYVEAALAALQSNHKPAALVTFSMAHDGAVHPSHDSALLLLVPFTALVSVNLDLQAGPDNAHSSNKAFCLQPLAALPCLSRLNLSSGNFQSVDAAEHLTHLSISNCQAECHEVCKCVTSLVELRLNCAVLHFFHTTGVCACSRLQLLACIQSCIHAVEPEETMHFADDYRHLASVPSSLSCLTCLTRLEVVHHNKNAECELAWLDQLPSLQCLLVSFHVQQLSFPEHCSVLSHLTQLYVVNLWRDAQTSFMVDWAKLVMLQELTLGSQVTSSQSLGSLMSLKLLKRVVWTVSQASSVDTVAQVALLAQQLGAARPDIAFHVKSCAYI